MPLSKQFVEGGWGVRHCLLTHTAPKHHRSLSTSPKLLGSWPGHVSQECGLEILRDQDEWVSEDQKNFLEYGCLDQTHDRLDQNCWGFRGLNPRNLFHKLPGRGWHVPRVGAG